MPKDIINLVTKTYFKTELKKKFKTQLKKFKKEFRAEINVDIKAAVAGAKYEIVSEIEEGNKKLRTDILGAVADFGKRVQDLETQSSVPSHQISALRHSQAL